ncbi:hypothetical protein KC725_01615 [Candidatus Peregrinibacteria bacterium]|nr:hypothetical protein [Candidatus Peregrinibacteria bacterium]
MGKSNLFTLFVTVIVVVIAAEFLVNDYGTIEDVGTNLLSADDNGEEVVEDEQPAHDWSITFDELAGEEVEDKGIDEATDISFDLGDFEENDGESPSTTEEPTTTAEAEISFGLIGLSGFQNVTLQRVPFNGILFERVDLRDFQSVEVVQQNLLQDNKEKIALFYEFHGDSDLLANEIYIYIKDKARNGLNVGINETNDYGDGSFYVNYTDIPDRAFLVVKTRESVYALTYEKRLHSFIESLLGYLNT